MALSEQEVWAGGEFNSTEDQQENHRADGGGFHTRQLYGVNRKVNSPGKHPLPLFTSDLAVIYTAFCLKTGVGTLVQCGREVWAEYQSVPVRCRKYHSVK